MFTVYVLRSKSTRKLYIGQSTNIERRFLEHQTGVARYTRGRGPWELLYTEVFENRGHVMQRERFLKSGQGREWLNTILPRRAGPPQAD